MNKLINAIKNTDAVNTLGLIEKLSVNSVLLTSEAILSRIHTINLLERRGKGKYRKDGYYWDGYDNSLSVLKRISDQDIMILNAYLNDSSYTIYLDLEYNLIGIIKLDDRGIEHLLKIQIDFNATKFDYYNNGEQRSIDEFLDNL
jgi:hypothetical protein